MPQITPLKPLPEQPASGRTAGRLSSVLVWVVTGLLALLALLLAGAFWWSGTEGSLATALRWASQSRLSSLQSLRAEEVTGSLRQGGRVARLRWDNTTLRITATQIDLRWQAQALLSGRLQIDRLHLARLEVESLPSQPSSGPPASLRLPVPVTLADFSIAQIGWVGPVALQATDLRGHYAYAGAQHALTLEHVQIASGHYQGRASLAADGALKLDADVTGSLDTTVPGSQRTLPLTLSGSVQGALTDLQLQAELKLAQTGSLQPHATTANPAAPATPATPANPVFTDKLARAAPSANASARLQPWAEQPLSEAEARFNALNLALLWPQAPQTSLTGSAQVKPTGDAGWALQATLQNAQPGPWDRRQLPIDKLRAAAEWRNGKLLLRALDARLGNGQLQARGEWSDAAPDNSSGNDWQAEMTLTQIDPGAIDSRLATQHVNGRAKLQSTGQRLAFDTELKALDARAASALQPASKKWLVPLALRDASARGVWLSRASGNLLELSALRVRSRDAEITASGQLQPKTWGAQGQLALVAPGLQAEVKGELQPHSGGGEFILNSRNTQQALAWLRSLPGLAALTDAIETAAPQGRGQLSVTWQGGWRDPELKASLNLPLLDWQAVSANTTSTLRLRDFQASLNGRLKQSQLKVQGQLNQGSRRITLALGAQGGTRDGSFTVWQALISQLQLSVEDPALGRGVWRAESLQAIQLQGDAAKVELGAGQARLVTTAAPGQALLAWQAASWRAGEIRSAGTVKELPLAWAELLSGTPFSQAGLVGNLLLDGDWDARIGNTLTLNAQLARRSGDITVQAETPEGLPMRVSAGIREARMSVSSENGEVNARLRWDSERAGTAEAQLRTQLQRHSSPAGQPDTPNFGGWYWPADAAIAGELKAQLPRLAAWSVLAPPGWRIRGSLATNIRLSGTRSAPQLSGDVQANDLALRSVVDGIEFGRGRLRASLDGTQMRIQEFTLQGAGANNTGGLLSAEGEAGWLHGAPLVRLSARLDRLRASSRTDRQLTVSGQLETMLKGGLAEINGQLRVDQARITLPDESSPQLGDDVVLRTTQGNTRTGAVVAPLRDARDPRAVKLAVQIDLGNDFRIEGKGVDTRMRGILALLGDSLGTPRLYGTLLTEGGQYRAYGQRLEIEEGLLRFTGPLDNPTLDVMAVRPNLTQRVGVRITGTALLPRVRLFSEPELSDAEKLSWLVLGRSSASGGAEGALLQQAALALLGSKGSGMQGGLATSLGLDELTLRAPTSSGDTTSAGAITLGKRFSRNFYAAYERSLSGTVGTLFMFYELSQRFTVRAQTGEQAAIDLIFTLPYE